MSQDSLHEPVEIQRPDDPGTTLRNARESQGLALQDVAARLKLSRQVVANIEASAWSKLPGDAFSRGYIRSYARLLGLDPNRLALEFDRVRGTLVTRPAPVPSGRIELHSRRKGSRLLKLSSMLMLLLIVASLVLWWQEKRDNPALDDTGSQLQALEDIRIDAMAMPDMLSAPPSPELASALAEIDRLMPSEPAAQTGDAESAEAAASEESLQPQDDVPAEAFPVETAQPSGQTELSADTRDLLRLDFSADCWVQISAGGQVLHSALMRAGQQIEMRHPGPLDLVLGAAQAVQSVHYQGRKVEFDSNRSGVLRLRVAQQE